MDNCMHEQEDFVPLLNSTTTPRQGKKTLAPSLSIRTLDGDVKNQHNYYNYYPNNFHVLSGGFQLPTLCPPFYFSNTKVSEPRMDSLVFPTEYSSELDEVELRSRALRSLLLLKRTRAIESVQNHVSRLPNDISTNKPSLDTAQSQPAIPEKRIIPSSRKSYATKLLAIGSGKLRAVPNNQNPLMSSERFVIYLSDSSCSSDEGELSEKLLNCVKSTHLKAKTGEVEKLSSQLVSSVVSCIVPTQLSVVTSTVSSNLKSNVAVIPMPSRQNVTNEVYPCIASHNHLASTKQHLHSPLLQNVMEQNKYSKRPTRVFRKLTTSSSCHKNIYGLPLCYDPTITSASQTNNLGTSLLSMCQNTSVQTADMSVTLAPSLTTEGNQRNPTRSSLLSPDSFITSIYLKIQKRLMQLSLDVLQRTRSASLMSHDFSFDPHSNVKYTQPRALSCPRRLPNHVDNVNLSSDEKPSENCTKYTHKVNPSIPLCPFLLDGECKDTLCIYQHPSVLDCHHQFEKSDLQATIPYSKNLSSPVCSSNVSTLAVTSPVYLLLTDENCHVCHESLDTMFPSSTLTAMQKWHALYRAYNRKNKGGPLPSQFRSESLEILKTVPTCSQMVTHHISTICLFSNNSQFAGDILTTLKLTAFSVSACRMVLRHPFVSPFIRISLGQLVIECLLNKLLNTEENRNLCTSLDLAFIHSVYHVCWLKLDLGCNIDSVTTLLGDLLQKLSKDDFLRWALWWLKLHVSITLHLPPEEFLSFSSPNYQLFTKVSVKSCRTLIEEAVRDLNLTALTTCNSASYLSKMPITGLSFCCLSVMSIYTQLLKFLEQYEEASEHSLHFYNISQLWVSDDDLLFTTAMHSLFITHSTSLDWNTLLAKARWLSHNVSTSVDYLSFRIEFHFLLALMTWRRKMHKTAKTALVELLGSLTMLNSEDDVEVLDGFRNLLGMPSEACENCNSVLVFFESLSTRGRTYIWLSYCLYGLLCNPTGQPLESILSQLIDYSHRLPEDHNCVFTRLLLRMIMTLTNRIHTSESDAYAMTIRTVFLDTPFRFRGVYLPDWFLEVIQGINLANLPSPGIRHDICVQLVETYGAPLVITLCRSLFALNDRFLASALCSIAKLDKPDKVDFWLLSAALVVSDQVPQGMLATKHRMSTLSRLVELLDEAIELIPSSITLWQLYTDAVIAFNVPIDQLLKRATSMGMTKVVSNEIEILKSSKTSPAAKKPNLNTGRRGPSGTPLSSNRWNKLITSKYIFKTWATRSIHSTPTGHYQRLQLQRKPAKS